MPSSSPQETPSLLVAWRSVCQDCDYAGALEHAVHRCPKCKGPLNLKCDYEVLSRVVNHTDWKESSARSSKYWRALPLSDFKHIISLQEGVTPLKRLAAMGKKYGLDHWYAKLESNNPTGVFKDRGSLLEISWAVQHGYTAVVCASTGNMAGSVAAYAAKAGLACFIFVPEGVPIGKLSMIIAYGAKVVAVRGNYNDCVRLAEHLANAYGYFLTGDYALRAEGSKTQAYEIVEQLHWQVPDWVAVPMGNGTNLSGIAKGFHDLQALDLVARIPRLIGVQAETAAPIVEAWHSGRTGAVATEMMADTVAQAANVGNPLDATKALAAIRKSNGHAVAVSEEEILCAQEELSRTESMFVEPSAALAGAGVQKLRAQGVIAPDQTVVTVLTGHGLKDPKSVLLRAVEPPVIEPKVEALDEFWKEKLYALTKISGAQGGETAWERGQMPPDPAGFVRQWFGVDLADAHVKILGQSIEQFHEKMATMSYHSLNLLVEDVTKLPPDYREIVRVADFTITVPKHAAPTAQVTVKLNGDTYDGQYHGVGPVDAVVTGVEEALKKSAHNIPHTLTDYDVEIDPAGQSRKGTPYGAGRGGTAAIVRVHLVLQHPLGAKVRGSAVSPDVITASVMAFERAYNLLYQKVTSQDVIPAKAGI